jgi:3-dehydrosphinganine reductase
MTFFKHAIVTGGSSGIGLAVARMAAARRAAVTIMARRPALLAAARCEIEAARLEPAQKVADISVDVADRPAVAAAVAAAETECGPCDLLVVSAGIAHPDYVDALSDEIFDRSMAVNYGGALNAVRAVLPGMKARRRGHIVLVSSGAGLVGMIGYAAYAPTKFALRGLAEVLRNELRPEGIAVSVAYPPDTDTPQLAAELATKPPETRAITAGAKTWSADGVAAAILKGVERRRFAITPGWEMTALYWLHSVAAPLIAGHFDRTVAKVRQQRSR